MRADVVMAEVLRLLDPAHIHETIGRRHDEAREAWRCDAITVRDGEAFLAAAGGYTRMHLEFVEEARLGANAAASLATELLRHGFPPGFIPDGYSAALACGVGKTPGGLPRVVNYLAGALKARAITNHVDAVFLHQVDPRERSERDEIAVVLLSRYGRALSHLGVAWREAQGLTTTAELPHLARRAAGLLLARRLTAGET